jgi:peptidoglycan/xylan/chitin deacetylase (PgdA/CDA1 family)
VPSFSSTRRGRTASGTFLDRYCAHRSSPIVLYHATFSDVPPDLDSGLHNVEPDVLIEQVRWLQRSYDVIGVDEWFERGGPLGTACITFDDAYRNICDEAVPRLIELGVPTTIFLNGVTFEGDVLWRDKVHFMISNDHVEDFLRSPIAERAGLDDITPAAFYQETKQPRRNSRVVDEAISEYLASTGLLDNLQRFAMGRRVEMIEHPLVRYGSHTYRHYLPSSLTAEEFRAELAENERVLDELEVNRSRVFSIPFGGGTSVNESAIAVLAEFGFTGVLYSRNATNFAARSRCGATTAGERYMAPASLAEFRLRHRRLSVMSPDATVRRIGRRSLEVVRRRPVS